MALVVLWVAGTTQAAEFGTREEAKAMLDKAVTAVKGNKEKALAMFNNGESGFKDRDLYVLCANTSDGIITASPSSNGQHLTDFAPGQEVMQTAAEGQIKEITYWVASSWFNQATKEAHLLYENWRSNLRCWILGTTGNSLEGFDTANRIRRHPVGSR